MATTLERADRIICAIMLDPKYLAQTEWERDYGLIRQIAELPFHEPDRIVSVVVNDPPDWDWWEPRYDQPGRREATRYREMVHALD